MSQKLTLQINSLEALERLIGGDSEVEMDIRQSVVEAFTKKHLKSLTNEETFIKVKQALLHESNTDIVEFVKNPHSFGYHWVLTAEARRRVEDLVKQRVDTEFATLVERVLPVSQMKTKIELLLDKQAQWIVDKLTEGNLERRLDAMVDQKLKEKLGIK